MSKSFFVRFLYAFRALSRISWKLDDEDSEGAAREWDITAKAVRAERTMTDSWT